MDLSVVIVNWNSGPHLECLLESLRPLAEELDAILVVDNASNDDSCSQETRGLVAARWMQNAENRGFAAAANQGVRQCRTSFVLLLNPDVTIEPESVRRLLRTIQADPQTALACGPLVGEDGSSQADFQFRPLPTTGGILREELFLDEIFPGGRSAQPENPQPAAAYWMIRKEVWDRLGGFDERFYPAWFEDVDYCRRLLDAGWTVAVDESCPARHSGGYSLTRLGYRNFLKAHRRNLLRYVGKNHPWSYPLIWPAVKAGLALRLLRGKPR